jgi:hypothetical protein
MRSILLAFELVYAVANTLHEVDSAVVGGDGMIAGLGLDCFTQCISTLRPD